MTARATVSAAQIENDFAVVAREGNSLRAYGWYWNTGDQNIAVVISFDCREADGAATEWAAYIGTSPTATYSTWEGAMLHAARRGVKLTRDEALAILAVPFPAGSDGSNILYKLPYRR